MAKKDLKINIKNTQIAQAIQLDKLKHKLDQKKADAKEKKSPKDAKDESAISKRAEEEHAKDEKEEAAPRRKARSKSVFAEAAVKEKDAEETLSVQVEEVHEEVETVPAVEVEHVPEPVKEQKPLPPPVEPQPIVAAPPKEEVKPVEPPPAPVVKVEKEILGPTGRHIKDLFPVKKKVEEKKEEVVKETAETAAAKKEKEKEKPKKPKAREEITTPTDDDKKGGKSKFKEFKDLKPARKQQVGRFDARDRQGLGEQEDDQRWRKRKTKLKEIVQEDLTIRPKDLHIRLPITVKDLASEMKLKSSQLIQKFFLQGMVVTINDVLDDETTIQLLGHEFDCEITIDTTEEERLRITDQTIKEEISGTDPETLTMRAPVVTFMGHVDHGKTSLIDYIRSSSIAAGEAGAITQHIGAFLCTTAVGNIAVLDTPGHEAFSEMRARGADVTDIVVLVIAGDEGIKAQTEEAINHAKAAGVTIIVAANKCDKPNFDIENVNRQLADHDLLPEAWGGQTIVVKCSAKTGEGVKELLEMLALQAEVLELRANPNTRARGTVLESELHKGMGSVATVLVQNGTLKLGDCLVFGEHYGRVKTMRDEFGNILSDAPPSTPVEITGLSGLPAAGDDFIAVPTEKEARDIAEARRVGERQKYLQQSKKASLESLFHQAADKKKKILKIVLRADVQGSLEALKAALLKIESEKVEIDIISAGVGEISESDVLLAAASKAIIIGFHTQVESHAESLIKQHKVHYTIHDIIYHAIDNVKDLMAGLLDKIEQENEKGKALVKATFKASQLGTIAGCIVTEGSIHRNNYVRVMRGGEMVWKGSISSLKRLKEDVREVAKGLECGILITNFNDVKEEDILEAYEITYITQEL